MAISLFFCESLARSREPSLDDDGFQSHFIVKNIILRDLSFHSLNVIILNRLWAKPVECERGALDPRTFKVPANDTR